MAEPYYSEISLYANNFSPRNWAYCNGQLMEIASNTALFSLLGTFYGGDGRSTFGLPDLKGRSPVGTGTGPGLTTKYIGMYGGFELSGLSYASMPAHGHPASATPKVSTGTLGGTPTATASVKCNNTSSDTGEPAGKVWGKYSGRGSLYTETLSGNDHMHAGAVSLSIDMSPVSVNIHAPVDGATISNTGGNDYHDNMPPFQVSPYCIALMGTYPSRN